jgi:hypothetical protein
MQLRCVERVESAATDGFPYRELYDSFQTQLRLFLLSVAIVIIVIFKIDAWSDVSGLAQMLMCCFVYQIHEVCNSND